MTSMAIQCRCGTVKGTVVKATPGFGNRVVCYCVDCQAYARFLGDESALLDPYGGSDIYQTAANCVSIDAGQSQLACVRLSPKGLYRFYASCCNTPFGNAVNGKLPLIGVFAGMFGDASLRDARLGQPRAWVQAEHANNLPKNIHGQNGFPLGITLRIVWKILSWKLTGKGQPSPLFTDEGAPVVAPQILSRSA